MRIPTTHENHGRFRDVGQRCGGVAAEQEDMVRERQVPRLTEKRDHRLSPSRPVSNGGYWGNYTSRRVCIGLEVGLSTPLADDCKCSGNGTSEHISKVDPVRLPFRQVERGESGWMVYVEFKDVPNRRGEREGGADDLGPDLAGLREMHTTVRVVRELHEVRSYLAGFVERNRIRWPSANRCACDNPGSRSEVRSRDEDATILLAEEDLTDLMVAVVCTDNEDSSFSGEETDAPFLNLESPVPEIAWSDDRQDQLLLWRRLTDRA